MDALGFHELDSLLASLAAMLEKILTGKLYEPNEDIQHYHEGIDLMPVNIKLSNN